MGRLKKLKMGNEGLERLSLKLKRLKIGHHIALESVELESLEHCRKVLERLKTGHVALEGLEGFEGCREGLLKGRWHNHLPQ